MTEDEAKTKWCPFARQLGILRASVASGKEDAIVAQGTQNRGYTMGGALSNCMCLGAGCMAWRFRESLEFRAKADAEFHKSGMRLASTEGYCGLAGTP